MRKRSLFLVIATGLLMGVYPLEAQDEFKSGPPVGKNVPGSFQAFNLNGPKGKDRFHCLVCEFQLNPVVVTFVREGEDAKEGELESYLKAVDKAVAKYRTVQFLSSFVVFLTPHASSAATEPKIEKPDEIIKDTEKRDKLADRLIEEAQLRTKLEERLVALTKKMDLKHTVVTYLAGDGPKGFNLSTKPGVTVVMYQKLKVEQVFAFPDGKLDEEATSRVLKGIDGMLKRKTVKKVEP